LSEEIVLDILKYEEMTREEAKKEVVRDPVSEPKLNS